MYGIQVSFKNTGQFDPAPEYDKSGYAAKAAETNNLGPNQPADAFGGGYGIIEMIGTATPKGLGYTTGGIKPAFTGKQDYYYITYVNGNLDRQSAFNNPEDDPVPDIVDGTPSKAKSAVYFADGPGASPTSIAATRAASGATWEYRSTGWSWFEYNGIQCSNWKPWHVILRAKKVGDYWIAQPSEVAPGAISLDATK